MSGHFTFMRKCLKLAKKGRGLVSPNPLVGSVIVKNDEVIAEGWHAKHGAIHAEIMALSNCSEKDLSDAVLYCNLEPCAHQTDKKINPPCVKAIIDSGIKTVVIAMIDPNPAVSGEGVKQLRTAGIEVITDVLIARATELNHVFKVNMIKQRPFILAKVAQTIDGFLATSNGDSRWITDEVARTHVHQMRSTYDAVLVSANTAVADNPSLTVRHVEGRQPKRLLIDRQLKTPIESNLFTDEFKDLTTVFTSVNRTESELKPLNDKNINLICIKEKNGHLDFNELCDQVFKLSIYSIYIEAGPDLFSFLLKERFVDRCHIYIAPKFLGTGKKLSLDFGIDKMDDALKFDHFYTRQIGETVFVEGQFE